VDAVGFVASRTTPASPPTTDRHAANGGGAVLRSPVRCDPACGHPQLERVTLPRGSRQPARPAAYWVSDEPVQNIEMLAPWLASVFAQTGLWPLLWRFEEDPENYMYGSGLIDEIDAVDLDAARAQEVPEAVRPLRAAVTHTAPGDLSTNPFPAWAFEEPARLLLVPCNRPADAVTALGGVAGEAQPPLISAVLRCWEEHHAAILYEVGPGLIRLTVAKPPDDDEHALSVAIDARVIMNHHDPRSVPDLAHEILTATAGPKVYAERVALQRDNWDISV
jgi:Domain of unknown function (DUF4253)